MSENLTIIIDKNKLLDTLKANKERFAKSYDALLIAYQKKVAEYKKNYAKFTKNALAKQINPDEGEPEAPQKPIDRTKEYDFYIEMLECHKDDTVTLSESMYRQLWRDRWDWTRSHWSALNAYNVSSYASAYAVLA